MWLNILSGAIRLPSCVIDIPPIHEVTPVPFRFACRPSDISFTGIASIESLSCGKLDDRAIARRDSESVHQRRARKDRLRHIDNKTLTLLTVKIKNDQTNNDIDKHLSGKISLIRKFDLLTRLKILNSKAFGRQSHSNYSSKPSLCRAVTIEIV